MKLSKLKIQNFRKLQNVEIVLGDATFLIGANNVGKTTTLDAIECLLELKAGLDLESVSRHVDTVNGSAVAEGGDIIIEGEFRDVSLNILNERGFNKDRLFSYDENGVTKYGFHYRVRYSRADGKTHREMKMHKQEFRPEFEQCNSPQSYIDAGIDAAYFNEMDLGIALSAKANKELRARIPELWNVLPDEEWVDNPGGIAPNVMSKLPKFLKVEAGSMQVELTEKGSMFKILADLFEEVRAASPNYQNALAALELLEAEMDPDDPTKDFGIMMQELNTVVDSVFPQSKIDVKANLSSKDALKPKFEIEMESNIRTKVDYQGTGMIRSVVFALLRYRKQRENVNSNDIIIGFEEPELFLHPNAANSMREIIYTLAVGSTQIVSTTHSPYMIDLSQRPRQILNSYSIGVNDYTTVFCFNHSQAFSNLQEDDKTRVKMIQKMDDYVSRAFFAQKVIIVEGDTEDVVFKQTIAVMPENVKKAVNERYQVIKATGKATIISFVKYLRAMNVDVFVVHDEDSQKPGAAVMNQPILDALGGDANKRYMMHDCVEDVLECPAPSSDKPYRAYIHVKDWQTWDDVPQTWKDAMRQVFSEFQGDL